MKLPNTLPWVVLASISVWFVWAVSLPFPEYPVQPASAWRHKRPLQIRGEASWYTYCLPSGWCSDDHFVAAMRDIPRYSTVRVTNVDNGKVIEVYITDYGPEEAVFPERVIDLSPAAFEAIRGANNGIIKQVKIQKL